MRPRLATVCVLLALLLVCFAWWTASGFEGAVTDLPPNLVREDGTEPMDCAPALSGRRSGATTGRVRSPQEGDESQVGSKPPDVTLRVDTVDAQTGAPLRAHWNLGTGRVIAAPFSNQQPITQEMIESQRKGVEASIARFEAAFVASGEVRGADGWVGRAGSFPLTVRPPAGYVLFDEMPQLAAPLAAGVREAVAVIPLWPEAVLDLRVFGPEGRPASGVVLEDFRVARRLHSVTWEVRGPGAFRVRGIPFLPGEPVSALVLREETGDAGDGVEELLEEVTEEMVDTPDLDTRVPATLTEPWTAVVRLGGAQIRDHLEVDNDMSFEESLGLSDARQGAPHGALLVRVLGWDGEPVQDAHVEDGVTDAEGEVLLADLPVGELTIRATAKGRLPIEDTVIVVEGEQTFLELREPEGAGLDVVVFDREGRAVPFARISIRQALVFDVVDGVQRLDRFTDRDGRRSFARVEPGLVTIVATWGSKSARRDGLLLDGRTTSVELSP